MCDTGTGNEYIGFPAYSLYIARFCMAYSDRRIPRKKKHSNWSADYHAAANNDGSFTRNINAVIIEHFNNSACGAWCKTVRSPEKTPAKLAGLILSTSFSRVNERFYLFPQTAPAETDGRSVCR